MSTPIDFYFDFSSPYGYFASLHIEKLAQQYGREVNWHAILLGPIFKAMNSAPLVSIPIKGDYSRHDIARTARFHNMLYQEPGVFPISSHIPARAVLWVQKNDAGKATHFIRTLFSAYFTENIDISKADHVLRIAADVGINAAQLEAGINDSSIKEELKAKVETAMAGGVFGSPFVVVDGEAFWGFDRFDQLAAFLKNGKI